jgi:hypothetical protein
MMVRAAHKPEDLGNEVPAPSGYYQPIDKALIDHAGRKVLYTSGIACVEASCCGMGSWQYVRVEGYVVEDERYQEQDLENRIEIEMIEGDDDKSAINKLLLERHPGARIEFR